MRSGEESAVAITLAHTSQLDSGALRAVRALLDEVFGPAMTDHAWDHALGGMHALVSEAGQLSPTARWCSAVSCINRGRFEPATSKQWPCGLTDAAVGMAHG